MSSFLQPALPRTALLASVALGAALILLGCTTQAPAEPHEPSATSTPAAEYADLPADLSADQVCALLPDQTAATLLEADVTSVTAGSHQVDCTWMYQLPDGPATTLQVQVMTMSQTSNRLGTEALDWALTRAPQGTPISEVSTLTVPNASYDVGGSTVILAVDSAGRLVSVAAHSDTAEAGHVGIVEEVLAALTD